MPWLAPGGLVGAGSPLPETVQALPEPPIFSKFAIAGVSRTQVLSTVPPPPVSVGAGASVEVGPGVGVDVGVDVGVGEGVNIGSEVQIRIAVIKASLDELSAAA